MSYDFVIVGGGCYGSYYVKQLLAARSRGKLSWSRVAVLDHDPGCRVGLAAPPDVDVIEVEWTAFGRLAFAEPELWMTGQLVPAPIAPHVVRHWLVDELEQSGCSVRDVSWPGSPPEQLPFSMVTDAGNLVLSWAPGLCPTNCIEPRKCPLTGADRTWEMPETVAQACAAAGVEHLETFVCRHYAYGVGTIGFDRIRQARQQLAELAHPCSVGFATVSACHGLVDVVELS